MTVYSVLGVDDLAVRAVNFELRLIRLDFFNGYGNSYAIWVDRIVGGSLSGGTPYTPNPLRQGAPAASAQARVGAGSIATGTLTAIAFAVAGPASYAIGDSNVAFGSYEFPYETTLSPGSSVRINGGGSLNTVLLYFEELRLNWSY